MATTKNKLMATNRDHLFLACAHADHEGYKDDPQFTLIDENGELVLRTGEEVLDTLTGAIAMLRYPEQRWLIQKEKIHDWRIYITSERFVGVHDIFFQKAFEFFDWIEEYGRFAGLHPTKEIGISEFFHWVGQKDKRLKKFSLVFQLAYTRINSISCIKTMTTDPSGIEFWYDDSPDASQTMIHIIPEPGKLSGEEIFD